MEVRKLCRVLVLMRYIIQLIASNCCLTKWKFPDDPIIIIQYDSDSVIHEATNCTFYEISDGEAEISIVLIKLIE